MNTSRSRSFRPVAGLGQVPLVLGPSSWMGPAVPLVPVAPPRGPMIVHDPLGVPPYYGEWGVVANGVTIESGRVGPYTTIEEAFEAATETAAAAGVTSMPFDGYAQVTDSRGMPVGPVT